MRVAIFTDNDFGKVNGVTTTLTAALKHAPADMSLRVYTADGTDRNDADYVSFRSPGTSLPYYHGMRIYWPHVHRYVERARQDRVQVVHLTTPGPLGMTAMFTAWRLRLPMVGSFHTDLAAYTTMLSGSAQLGRIMGRFLHLPYDRCQRILVPSAATGDMLQRAGFDHIKLELWPRGIDSDLFTPARRSAALRDEWQASGGVPVVVYAGRVSREKGLDRLPAIHAVLRDLGVAHRFVIIGDGPFRPELERMLSPAVFTGMLSPQDVAAAMASADVFLFPSDTDTAGNVVLEAQASGLPVVVSSRGGPREYMRDGSTGFVCRAGDVADFSGRLAELLRNHDRRAAFGRAARDFACARRWSQALQPLYRTYREAAAAPGFAHAAARSWASSSSGDIGG